MVKTVCNPMMMGKLPLRRKGCCLFRVLECARDAVLLSP